MSGGARSNYRPRGPRWHAECPHCHRPTGVTFNRATGDALLRTHNDPAAKRQCPMSRAAVSREGLYLP